MCPLVEEYADKKVKKALIEVVKSVMDKLEYSAEEAMELVNVPMDSRATLKRKLETIG